MEISPVIIVKNASRTIAQTLESLKEFDEVIVYDTGSEDETMEIARRYNNVKLCRGKFYGFGRSKNKASLLTKNDWIFSIDADEVVSPQLMNSIKNLQLHDSCVYQIKRYNYYRKRRILHSGWGLEHIIRIYNKNLISFNEKLVHEHIEVGNSKVIALEGELRHFSYSSVSDFIQKRDLYSELFARENQGKRKSSPIKALLHATFDFFNTYFFRLGFLDGYRGLLIAVLNANVSFYKYLKLYEANIQNDAKVSLTILLQIDSWKIIHGLLESALNQTVAPDEIILVANPLKKDTLEHIDSYAKKSFIPIHFFYSKNTNEYIEPCNLAIEQSRGEYLIFIEGKGFLHKNFVHDHVKYAKRGRFLFGELMLLKKDNVEKSLPENLKNSRYINGIKYFCSSFSLLSFVKSEIKPFSKADLAPFNLSFFKDELLNIVETKAGVVDFEKVKNDLLRKLKFSGLKKRKLKFSGIQCVLAHNKMPDDDTDKKVLVCLDRLKHPNCGLGQVSLNMGRKLIETQTPGISYSFLLPADGYPEFDNKTSIENLFTYRNFMAGYMKKYDVCHIIHQLPSFKFGKAKRNLITIHDLNFLYTKSNPKKQKYLKKLQKNIDKADAITFISEFTKEISYKYLNISDNKIVRVIYNGVTAPAQENVKPAWLPEKQFLFSIGQFLEKKNFHVLIPFLKLIPPEIILVLAGENQTHYGHKMKQLVADNNLSKRVLMPGGISDSDKNYLYHHCSAFLFPSIAEGFGLPVIEAMLSYKPVFCSDRTSLKEIGGDFAFFWENFSPAYMFEVYNKGLMLFANEDFKLRQKEYANTFTHEKNIQEYIKLYQELIELQ